MDKELAVKFTKLHLHAAECINNLNEGIELNTEILKRFIEIQLEFDSVLIEILSALDNGQESLKIEQLERMVDNAKQ